MFCLNIHRLVVRRWNTILNINSNFSVDKAVVDYNNMLFAANSVTSKIVLSKLI